MKSQTIRVLVVDDDEDEYIVVDKYLRRAVTATYSVDWVSSFEKALEFVAKDVHEICLLDYQLGEHTGIELLREMRARGYRRPVILLTGHGNVEVDMQAMELGAFDYIEKAHLTPALIERSIRYAIENYRVRDALREANEELENRVRERTAELHRSNLELEQFAEIVARDLQQPLRMLADHVGIIEPELAGADPRKMLDSLTGSMDCIFLEVRNMELLVQLVLDYSLTRRQRQPFSDIDLGEVAREVCRALDYRIQRAGARVTVGELPIVKGDRRLMRGVFENLIDNALKYRTQSAPQIEIAASRKGDQWFCEVHDNGLGVSEEDADEIFLMFSRGSHGQAARGVGIGLALCRKIIEYHGGHIWVDSPGEGGSTFFFSIPVE
jgi:signal transduction histidine kinase